MEAVTRSFVNELLEPRRLLSLTPLGVEFRVNTFTQGTQSVPAIAMDADGDFVLAWQSNGQDGAGYGVFAQRFNASGVAQGAEYQVNTFTTDSQSAAAVAMDADGDFIIAWQSNTQDGNLTGIYAQRYDAVGMPQGSEFRVNTHTTNRQTSPAVAMDAAGNFVVAWQSVGQDGSGESIHAQRYDAGGVAQGGEFRVNTFISNNQSIPAVAMDDAGNFVVTWESAGQDGSGLSVHAQRYDASGVAQGVEFRVNTFTTNSQSSPSVAMDADGDFVIAWESYQQDGGHFGIYAQRYDASGVAQSAEFRVNTTTVGNQSLPSVAMSDGGDFVVTWRGPDANGFGIYLQGYSASGTPNDIELPANTVTASVQTAAAIAMDGDNDIVAAWQSFGQDGSGYGIYARRYEILSGVLSSAFLFEAAPHRVAFTFDDNFSTNLGTDDIMLENLTTSQTIPATDLMLSYDLPTNTATFSYIGNASGIGGVLPDGEYRATLLAAGITDPGGQPLPADYVLDFFFLNGDANHDGFVNLSDFNILAANFGQSPRTFSQGDFSYDGLVNLNDFNILAARFGILLVGPASVLRPSPLDSMRRGDSIPRDDPMKELLA